MQISSCTGKVPNNYSVDKGGIFNFACLGKVATKFVHGKGTLFLIIPLHIMCGDTSSSTGILLSVLIFRRQHNRVRGPCSETQRHQSREHSATTTKFAQTEGTFLRHFHTPKSDNRSECGRSSNSIFLSKRSKIGKIGYLFWYCAARTYSGPDDWWVNEWSVGIFLRLVG